MDLIVALRAVRKRLAPPQGIDRLQDRLTRELVAEGNAVALLLQHPDGDAIGQAIRACDKRLFEDPVLNARADHGGQLQQVAAARLELRGSRQHGIAYGHRNAAAGGRDDLRDEEWISGRLPMQRLHIESLAGDELADRIDAQTRQLNAMHCVRAREIPEQRPERMLPADLVIAVRGDQQSPHRRNAAAQVLDQVERRLVGPMDVLDNEDDGLGAAPQKFEEGGEQGRPAGCALEPAQQLSASELARNVIEWCQRRRREERVAIALENAGRARMHRGEVLDKRGLADAGLAADERDRNPALR